MTRKLLKIGFDGIVCRHEESRIYQLARLPTFYCAVSTTLSKEQKAEMVSSMRRYFADELDFEVSELQAGFVLEYFFSEMAPFAYNQGVEDAQKYFISASEDLTGTCFQEALTYWKARNRGGDVRRKPKE